MKTTRYFENAQDFIDNEDKIALNDLWVFEGVGNKEKALKLVEEILKSDKPNFFKTTVENLESIDSASKYLDYLLNGSDDTSLIWADGPYASFEDDNFVIDFSPL